VLDAAEAMVPSVPDVSDIGEPRGPFGAVPESAVTSKGAAVDQSTVATGLDAIAQAVPAPVPKPSTLRDVARFAGRAITSTIEGVTGATAGAVSEGFASGPPGGREAGSDRGAVSQPSRGRAPTRRAVASTGSGGFEPDEIWTPQPRTVSRSRPAALDSNSDAARTVAGLSILGGIAYLVGRG
jgi:hypothetical protein